MGLQGLKRVITGVLDLEGSDLTPDTNVAGQNGQKDKFSLGPQNKVSPAENSLEILQLKQI